jgi:hypothetical protein
MGVAAFSGQRHGDLVHRSRHARALVTLAATVACLVLSAGAGASPSELEQTGQLTMTSDAGDYIGQGGEYSYATPANVFFGTARSWAGENNLVSVTMRTDAASTDYWILEFAAAPGQTLTPGTYSDAARVGSQAAGQPGLDVSGMGRGCNTLTGNFTVSDAVYGPYGYVQSFHATFEQHCEGGATALHGEVSVSNPPPPPPLSTQLTIAPTGQIGPRGSVNLTGTITCNRPVDPQRSYIQLTVSQPSKTGTLAGAAAFSVPSNCSTTPSTWQATVTPQDPKAPFIKGSVSVNGWTQVGDPFFDVLVTAGPVTATVTIREN